MPTTADAQQEEIQISLSRQTNTLYNIFNQISRQTGLFFIYDSDLVDSDKQIRIPRTQTSLKNFLYKVIENPDVEFKIFDHHIMILPREKSPVPGQEATPDKPVSVHDFILLKGRIIDHGTGAPLPYSAISLRNRPTGVPANDNGIFQFKLSRTYAEDTLMISHLGYQTRFLPVNLLKKGFADIALQPDYISLQEIIITAFDPVTVMARVLDRINNNYPSRPVNHISFYREGILSDEKVMMYSEAILREYKPSHQSPMQEQATLIQSRNISNINREDTLIFKLKAGIKSSAELDVIKNTPDFMHPDFMNEYHYEAAGVLATDNGYAYIIDFEQRKNIQGPLHKGTIFVDRETYAIISVEFAINDKYIRSIQSRFLPKPNPNFVINIQSASYSVSYQPCNIDNTYYLSRVKGELNLRARPRNKLFGRNYRVFFEKAIVQTQTENVSRIRRREAIRSNVVFADQDYQYDYDFWGEYNIIPPEREISEALSRINSKIESLITE